ncbi:hypothetical protein [Siccirubricoccus phaeus]|uniref:hypothetical protein n=1 Tax=Siccirubricoccus phaeus TaxID=2595053 RepID=UPI001A9C7BD7|nr:hypothetical protein [Siccirubricoccus phaeus]
MPQQRESREERLAERPASPAAGGGAALLRRAADGLGLAAAPGFALMALLAAAPGPAAALCGGAMASPLQGMAAMYLLMSLVHAAPWLRLLARRRGGAARPGTRAGPRRPAQAAQGRMA